MILVTSDKNFKLGGSVKTSINPSEMAVASRCMGSVFLSRFDGVHPMATIGKEAHNEIEKKVKEAFKKKKRVYTDFDKADTKKLLNEYLDYIYDVGKSNPSHFGIECRVDDLYYNTLIGGICDFFYVQDGQLIVADLKTGYKPLKDLHFAQLYVYGIALASILKYKREEEINFVLFTRYGLKEQRFTFEKLLLKKNEFLRHQREGGFKIGDHCLDCYSFKRCDVVQKECKNMINEIAKEKPKNFEKYYKLRKHIEKFYKEIDQSLIDKHDAGKDIGNFVVEETRGKKIWKSEFKSELMSTEGMVEPKLISVREALEKGFDVDEKYNLIKTRKIKLRNK